MALICVCKAYICELAALAGHQGRPYCGGIINGTRLIDSHWPDGEKLAHFYNVPDRETADRLAAESRAVSAPDPFEKPYQELAGVIDWLLRNTDAVGTESRLIELYESDLGILNIEKLLRQLTSAGVKFLESVFPGKEVLELTDSLYWNGMHHQRPVVHALMIMSLGGIPWISHYKS